ncbi:hypothetical protein [Flavobacterium soyangense]|uniref:SnoaL-like domain-containing protein n=1 Tax=Flavobacterium soyangense TaxID=2023265 RepID=A0A930UCG2_9FLAO|nr:hypothetical protein [Flavobacterium soyangense]MBF2709642.1 hypothetical protein [Flavobacterium soyangense]
MELFKKSITKKIILTSCLFFFGIVAFSQKEEKNGTIYIKHPYIDAVNNAAKAYLAKDDATNRKIYSDTARFWASGMTKRVKLEEALKMWDSDFDYYTDVKQTPVGYPDYLHYKDQDQKYVQSWWKWSGKSKKTGEVITINFVQFDLFNKDGKIADESLYGDFSKMVKE